MGVLASRVTVAVTATLIADASSDPMGDGGQRASIRNRGTVAVYLGSSAVTTAVGYQLDPGEAVGLWLSTQEKIYGIVASGTAVVHVLQGGA